MRLAFDTSVLVAGQVEPHPFHDRALPWIEEVTTARVEGECTWHGIAETWGVLTRIPLEPAISPALAELAMRRLLESFHPVELSEDVYRRALRRCAERNLRSGAVFDALHLISAESRRVEALVTFNRADFERLTTESSPPIVVPPEPPAYTLAPSE